MDTQRPHDPFEPMVHLLRNWLASARLREIIHALLLVREELTRRGVTLLWSLRQADPPAQDAPCSSEERHVEV